MARLTVKQLASLSGVSVRTLHHYDHIDLLKPCDVGDNGYRYYDRPEMLRLQQILFYRQLQMSLADIKITLDADGFDLAGALHTHRKRLVDDLERHQILIRTIDKTLDELNGDQDMENPFKGFSPQKQNAYEQELAAQGGQTTQAHITEAKRNVAKLSQQAHDVIKAEGHAINLALVECIEAGQEQNSEDVQVLMARHHRWVSNYWVPNGQAYAGLGQQYADHPDFRLFYDKYDPRLVDFLAGAMKMYAKAALD